MLAVIQPTEIEARANETFEALLWSLSRPGEIRILPVPGVETIAESLCDREVSLFCFDDILQSRLKRTGARPAALDDADYVFINISLDGERAAMLSRVNAGDMLYPETAATVVMMATLGEGAKLRLSGPGIDGSRVVSIGGIDPSFWTVRQAACRYPLGWDVFFVDGDRVLGLPRSTKVEVL